MKRLKLNENENCHWSKSRLIIGLLYWGDDPITCSRAEELFDMEPENLKIFPHSDAVFWHISPHFISALSYEMIRTVLSYSFSSTNHSFLYIIVWNVLDQCSERQEGKLSIVPWCRVLLDLCLEFTLCNLHLWNPNREFSSHTSRITWIKIWPTYTMGSTGVHSLALSPHRKKILSWSPLGRQGQVQWCL